MKKLIRSIEVRILYARMALRSINRPHLGDVVIYDDVECSLIQGVASPYWDMIPMIKENFELDRRVIFKRIHENDFKLQPLWKRFKFSFMFTYNFYMSNWYRIDIDKERGISFVKN